MERESEGGWMLRIKKFLMISSSEQNVTYYFCLRRRRAFPPPRLPPWPGPSPYPLARRGGGVGLSD